MDKKTFFNALEKLDDTYYDEAATYKPSEKKASPKRLIAAAACLCVVIAVAFIGPKVFKENETNLTTPVTSPEIAYETRTSTGDHQGELSSPKADNDNTAPSSGSAIIIETARETTWNEETVTSPPQFPNKATDVAQTIVLDEKTYYVCGEGEAEVLSACGLSEKPTAELAGQQLSFLSFDKSSNSYVKTDEEESDGILFEYAPQKTENIYIILYRGNYYAAVLHDESGYHGLNG